MLMPHRRLYAKTSSTWNTLGDYQGHAQRRSIRTATPTNLSHCTVSSLATQMICMTACAFDPHRTKDVGTKKKGHKCGSAAGHVTNSRKPLRHQQSATTTDVGLPRLDRICRYGNFQDRSRRRLTCVGRSECFVEEGATPQVNVR